MYIYPQHVYILNLYKINLHVVSEQAESFHDFYYVIVDNNNNCLYND